MTGTAVSAVDAALDRAEWQRIVFAEHPRRLQLLRLKPSFPLRPLRIHVLRNQPFEYVGTLARQLLSYAGWDAEFAYGPYDDSLATGADPDAAVELVWLDFGRFALPDEGLLEALAQRLASLRAATDRPILVFDRPGAPEFNKELAGLVEPLPGVHALAQGDIAEELGAQYVDARMESVAGLSLSDAALIETARRLALRWLPAALGPQVKALLLDLDGTLWGGVVGEDGVDGIEIGQAHRAVHERLLELRARGLLLALVSRNDRADVEAAFSKRADLTLRLEHFSAVRCTWGAKSDAAREVLDELRIGADAAVFVDDNSGELAEVVSALPDIGSLMATDPSDLLAALQWYPGLETFAATTTDAVRAADLAAAGRRAELAREAEDPLEYIRSLRVVATFSVDNPADRERLQQLSAKTNQFNTTLSRLTEAAVARYIEDPVRHAVAVAVRDRLSDSGVVAGVFSRLEGGVLRIDEIAISCRALGRGLETALVLEALRRSGAADGGLVEVTYRPGPRNAPAREWLEAELGSPPQGGGEVSFRWDADRVAERLAAIPLRVA